MVAKVNEEKCIGCAACVSACPVTAIAMDSGKNKACVDKNVCIDCGACVSECPVEAIAMSE